MLMSDETVLRVSNATQVDHTKRLSNGVGLGGLVAIVPSMGQWEVGGNNIA